MAAVTSATTQTSQTELVPAEVIDNAIFEANRSELTALALANVKVLQPGTGNAVKLPRWVVTATPAGTKTETDEFEIMEITTEEESVSAGYVGGYIHVSDELRDRGVHDAISESAQQAVLSLRDRIDTDGLALIKSASNTESFTGEAFTTIKFGVAAATYAALKPNGSRHAMLMSLNMLKAFKASMEGNAAAMFGLDALSAEIISKRGPQAGFKGMWDGFEIYVSPNCPTTSNDANAAMMVAGQGGPLVYLVEKPINAEQERFPKRKGTEVTIAASYGWGLGKQDLILEILASNL